MWYSVSLKPMQTNLIFFLNISIFASLSIIFTSKSQCSCLITQIERIASMRKFEFTFWRKNNKTVQWNEKEAVYNNEKNKAEYQKHLLHSMTDQVVVFKHSFPYLLIALTPIFPLFSAIQDDIITSCKHRTSASKFWQIKIFLSSLFGFD